MNNENKNAEEIIEEATEEVTEVTVENADTAEKEAARKSSAPEKQGNIFASAKFKRGTMATILSLVFILLVVVVNVLTTMLTERFPSMNIDLTAQKLNTLSDQAIEIAKDIENDTEIIIIANEDKARQDKIYSDVQYSQVTNLADKLHEVNSKITVSFKDPDTEPGFISEYPDETLTSGKVMVRTDKRYKLLTISDLFNVSQNSTTGAYDYFSTVDGALANAIYMANLDKTPVMSIAVGHNEILTETSRESFKTLLTDQSFTVKSFNILTDEIPDDTQILMIPTPATDYTKEEIEKLRAFIDTETEGISKAILYTCYPSQGSMPNLAGFLEEWGVQVEEGIVAETNVNQVVAADASFILAQATTEQLAGNSYSYLVSPMTSPLTLLFSANNDIATKKLWVSSDTAYVHISEDSDSSQTSQQILATKSYKFTNNGSNENSVIVMGSSMALTSDFMGSNTFGNRSYITDLFVEMTGIAQNSMSIEEVQTNTMDIAMTQGTTMFLGLGVFTIAIPLLILITGLIIFLRRRHL